MVVVIWRLINLTPHELVLYGAGNEVLLRRPRAADPARLVEQRTDTGVLGVIREGADVASSVPVRDVRYAEDVTGLPAPESGVRYVVSRVTAQACTHRIDLLFPLDEVRDARGRIVGCRALGKFSGGGL